MTDHMHPIFSQMLRNTQLAYGMKPTEYPPPRPPEEVRQELAKKPVTAESSADAI